MDNMDVSIDRASTTTITEESTDRGQRTCCHPSKNWYRFLGLFFMCFLGFGSYFCYDFPGALQNQVKHDMSVNTEEFTGLYAYYSWPNVILSFVGGYFIDKYLGIPFGTVFFSIMLTVGHYIVAFGALGNRYWVMEAGRLVFGVGCESLAVAQNAYAVSWFKGKELNMVFGLLLSMARVGSTVNFLTTAKIYSWVGGGSTGYKVLGITLLVVGVTCVFSLACAIILGLMDRRRTKVLNIRHESAGETVSIKDLFTFPLQFWLLCVICVTYYVAIFPFISLSKMYFMNKDRSSESTANEISSIVYVISAVASPICGALVDRYGKNILWVILSIVTTGICHLAMALTYISPIYPMSLMGVSYSMLASSLWPMVALILPESSLGTAYGIMQSVQNLGLAVISMAAGWIVDKHGYFALELFFIFWLELALISSVGIWWVDSPERFGLNLNAQQRKLKNSESENPELEDGSSQPLLSDQ